MAIFIAIVVFVGILIYSFSTSSNKNNSSISNDIEFEDIYIIDEDIFDEKRDGFI